MLFRILVGALLLMSLPLFATAEKDTFTLKDPTGDDYGDGTLVYPLRDDMKKGDLDLISLSARPEDGGTLFEAVFANNIVDPGYRAIDVGGKPLNQIIRVGFYTFNLDVYIDKDGVKGSGEERMIPGRRAAIVPENAWEKVVCLTPRPAEAESLLEKILERRAYEDWKQEKGRVDPEDEVEIKGKVKQAMNNNYFFPTRVRVTGKKVNFFVPVSFLGGPPKPEWNYVVAVTASPIEQKMDFSMWFGKDQKEEMPLMNYIVLPGRPPDNLGTTRRERDDLQPPILDIIAPDDQKQSEILRSYDPKTGTPALLPGVKAQ
jgi:hypothetical protein